MSSMPPPERSDSYPYEAPGYSLSDADSISVLSDSSTLRSMKLASFSDLKHQSEGGYGKETCSDKHRLNRAPSLAFDSTYLSEKTLPVAPHEQPVQMRQSRPGRSQSPGHRKILNSSHRLHSPNPRNTSRSPARPDKTQLGALAGSLGPDNVPHMAELDSIPCAGIRIPSGPLIGLLAWRLVVRVHAPWNRHRTQASFAQEFKMLPETDIRRKKNMPRAQNTEDPRGAMVKDTEVRKGRRASWNALNTPSEGRPSAGFKAGRDHTVSEMAEISPFGLPPPPNVYQTKRGHFASQSAASLPLMGLVKSHSPSSGIDEDGDWDVLPSPARPWDSSSALVYGRRSPSPSAKASRRPLSSIFASTSGHSSPLPSVYNEPQPEVRTAVADALVTNFLFDTSLGYSTISRETLFALGINPVLIEALDASEVSNHEPKTVSLFIQNLPRPITFRLAPEGKPSKLGVQFLLESGVNLCMGEGEAGAVLWLDRADRRISLSQVPRTVPLPKVSLQARVRALFGLQ